MTSQVNVSHIGNQDASKNVPVDTLIAGSAKAWVNFNGTGAVAIQDSFNVTSITDNGTGSYTVNLTAAFPTANYAVMSAVGDASASRNLRIGGLTVNGIGVVTTDATDTTLTDANLIFISAFSN